MADFLKEFEDQQTKSLKGRQKTFDRQVKTIEKSALGEAKTEEKVKKINKPVGPKPNFAPIDEIDDKPTRGLAKRAFMRAERQDQSPEKAAEMIKTDLKKHNILKS